MKLLTKASYSPDVTQREQENLAVAYIAACEAMVLLKNDGTLPFKTKKIALYGPGASMTIKGGTGSGEVNERHSVTILEGLEDRGFEITTRSWIEDFEKYYAEAERAYKEEKKKRINILKPGSIMQMLFDNFRAPAGRVVTDEDIAASDTDSCIYVLSRQAGEGGDRKAEKGDMFLTDEEAATIRLCAEKYEHFLLVINCGSAIDMAFAEEIPGINAILYLCQLGNEGGMLLRMWSAARSRPPVSSPIPGPSSTAIFPTPTNTATSTVIWTTNTTRKASMWATATLIPSAWSLPIPSALA